MGMITYDMGRLKQAVVLLLDFKFGKGRCARLKESIARLPKGRKFTGVIEPLNEIVDIARQEPLRAQTIVLLADSRREELKREVEKASPMLTKRREANRRCTAGTRKRTKESIEAEELRRGYKLNEAERKQFMAGLRREWKISAKRFIEEHPKMSYHEAMSAFSEQLNARVTKRYERAKEEYDNGRLSSSSQRRLEDNKQPKRNWKQGVSQATLNRLKEKFK